MSVAAVSPPNGRRVRAVMVVVEDVASGAADLASVLPLVTEHDARLTLVLCPATPWWLSLSWLVGDTDSGVSHLDRISESLRGRLLELIPQDVCVVLVEVRGDCSSAVRDLLHDEPHDVVVGPRGVTRYRTTQGRNADHSWTLS
jgi:hypothetical protein